jgi:phosphoenolpyruvate-protein phosphotransferase (PTS system enzyme I)
MPGRRTFYFDGLGVSGGVAIGPAFVLETQGLNVESSPILPEDVDQEIERFYRAVELAKEEVTELGRQVAQVIDTGQAAIFDAHVALLSDPMMIEKTIKSIRKNNQSAEHVFWHITKEIGLQLEALGDSYFSERSNDIYDIARRVLKFLGHGNDPTGATMAEDSIIIANDLGPAETAILHRDKISGFATNVGGATSHTAILAKALSLPAVVGLDYISHYVRTGDMVILDGTKGKVLLNPAPEQIEEYRALQDEYRKARENLTEVVTLPAMTLDGELISMEANIEFINELDMVDANGAEGIGLFRTEYFFIERRTLPSESEQLEAYSQVLDHMGDRPVVFRTLDVGGDKLAYSIPTPNESNPFLGLRAIRLCLAYPDLFRCQLRPLFKAGAGKKLNLMLPMVSGVQEIREAKRFIQDVREELTREGVEPPSQFRLGVMIEIPSACLQAEEMASEVDFFSIGTNDLIQYTIAVDRVNKTVGHLYQETHPAVLRLIAMVVDAAKRTGTPLAVCGEMAGDPVLSLLLIGLGVRTLSMSPGLLTLVKKSIRSHELDFLKELAAELLLLPTSHQIRETLENRLEVYENTLSEKTF